MRPYTPPPPNKEKVKPKDQKLLFLFFFPCESQRFSIRTGGRRGGELTRRPVLQTLTSRLQFGKPQLLDFLCDFLKKIVIFEPPERAWLPDRILLAVQGIASKATGGRSPVEELMHSWCWTWSFLVVLFPSHENTFNFEWLQLYRVSPLTPEEIR